MVKFVRDNNTEEYMKELLLQSIPEGKHNSVSCKHLAFRLGCDKRTVVKLVQKLRDDGHPICSTTYDGYWIAIDVEDIDRTVKALRVRVTSLTDTIDSLMEARRLLLRKE
jgi:biotin operon repressor